MVTPGATTVARRPITDQTAQAAHNNKGGGACRSRNVWVRARYAKAAAERSFAR